MPLPLPSHCRTRQQTLLFLFRHLALLVDAKGSYRRLGEFINVHPVTIQYWIRNDACPAEQVAAIKERFAGHIKARRCYDLDLLVSRSAAAEATRV